MNGMKYPPGGTPVKQGDDKEILRALRKLKRCTQRLLTDRGRHFVYCGGYYHGKTTKTAKGYRCKEHRP